MKWRETTSVRAFSTRGKALMGLLSAFVAGAAFVALRPDTTADAADHGDAPLVQSNPAFDINDVYAFRPAATDDLCIIVTVFPSLPGSPVGNMFGNDGFYMIDIDNNDDNQPDFTIQTVFDGQGAAQDFTVTGLGGVTLTQDVSTASSPAIASATVTGGTMRAWAGLAEDPFFFDLAGFQAFLAGNYVPAMGLRSATGGTPADFFAGRNVSAIAVQFPITLVNGGGGANTGSVNISARTLQQ